MLIRTIVALVLSTGILTANHDVCDIDHIYDTGYSYSLPKNVLQGFLSGKAFDHPEPYSQEESQRLRDDINTLYQNILVEAPLREKVAIITAGAPGAGKTVKLRQDLEANRLRGKNYAYVCPDDVCLKNQIRTHKADIDNSDGSPEAHQAAYNKWRPGSNAAAHLILGNLIREQYGFYFGSTSSGPATGKFFEFIKKQGYKIRLIHITAPDDVRWESIKERDKTFVQTTAQDVKEKGYLLPQRINDTFLAYADEIEFYYRDAVKQDARLAARWVRSEDQGALQIVSGVDYEQVKAIHNAVVKTLQRPDLAWERTVEQNSTILGRGL
jgi:hypothetical protein